MVDPKPLYQPEPEFSEASRKKGENGNVDIALVVGTDGLPYDLKLMCSSIPDSNQSAIEAVKQWRLKPGFKDGAPVTVAATIEVNFRLM